MVAKLLEAMPGPADGNGERTLSRTASAARKLAAEIVPLFKNDSCLGCEPTRGSRSRSSRSRSRSRSECARQRQRQKCAVLTKAITSPSKFSAF